MQAFYTDHFVLPLPETHRFPMRKYALLRERVAAELPHVDLRVPDAVTDDDLRRAHDADYVRRVLDGSLTDREIRVMGFPWSPALVERSRRSAGGTLAAARAALTDGVAVNLAGGTHHASADRGQGYCVFNDAAIAARALQADGVVRRVVVVDCDVHQGNGTAAIFRADPTVFTFSIHAARNFPFEKAESDLDVPLPDRVTDADYLAALDRGLVTALDRADADLAIYVAGVDPYEHDALGRLSLTAEGLRRRDRLVLDRCRAAGLPVAIAMAGGYAKQVDDIAALHLATVREAALTE